MKKSNKLSQRLKEARDEAIIQMFDRQYSAEEIGEIFNLSTAAVYNIVKENKLSR